MPFSDDLKLAIKKRADFTCCWCLDRRQIVEIHHIVPQAQDGPNTEDNAAPLCGSCHSLYGDNPRLRKEMRARRDQWYTQCETRLIFAWPTVPASPLLDRSEITYVTEQPSKGGVNILDGTPGVRMSGPDRSLALLVVYIEQHVAGTQGFNRYIEVTAYTAVGLAIRIRVGPLDDWLVSGLMKTLRDELDIWILWGPEHTPATVTSDFDHMHAFGLMRMKSGENLLYMRAATGDGAVLSISAKFTNIAATGVADWLESVGITKPI